MIPDWIDVPAVVLGIGITLFCAILLRWHVQDGPFDFRNTLIKNDKISLSRLGQLVALVVSTGVLIYQTVKGQLTEWLYTGYIVTWAGTYVANKFAPKENGNGNSGNSG